MSVGTNANEAVSVTVADLVQLARPAATLKLGRTQGRASLIGDYLSPFKGRGMEFDESRPYQAGDDVRNLNWRVMARTGKPFTKLFREERERPVFLWVDLRQRMLFATRGMFKAVLAARAAALIAWAASYNGDRVGGVIFSEREHHELKPTRGKRGVLRLINRLATHPAWSHNGEGGSDDAAYEALLRLRHVVRPGSLVFLLSDFGGLGPKTQAHLSQLALHNELTFFFVHDPFEAELPPPGTYRLSDGDAEWVLDATDRGYRSEYSARFEQHHADVRRLARRNRIALISCRTDQDPLATLQHGLFVGS